jgi:hypothetical protein
MKIPLDFIAHNIIIHSFNRPQGLKIEEIKKLLDPLSFPAPELEDYEKPLKKYLIFYDAVDGVIYMGKGNKIEMKKVIKAYLKDSGAPEDFTVYFSGSGNYFKYEIEKDSCDFFPTLSEAIGGDRADNISLKNQMILEKWFLGNPIDVTEEVGEYFLELFKS